MKKRLDPKAAIQKVAKKMIKKPPQYPNFRVGDTLRVYVKVKEGEKTRTQPFEGIVIAIQNKQERSSFTVRKIASGVGVERIFPYFSPVIDRIMLVSKGEVRRSKLYYLRELTGRKGRIRSEYVYQDTLAASDSAESADATVSDEDEAEDVSRNAQAAGA
ncbi:MAG: 50S ribosomal protein L19 [Bradymonadales bacterium]|nr:MAG: 50S ribosomal protein L19 [Bradymonadales bacterium]